VQLIDAKSHTAIAVAGGAGRAVAAGNRFQLLLREVPDGLVRGVAAQRVGLLVRVQLFHGNLLRFRRGRCDTVSAPSVKNEPARVIPYMTEITLLLNSEIEAVRPARFTRDSREPTIPRRIGGDWGSDEGHVDDK
jgi:hypothetical protein